MSAIKAAVRAAVPDFVYRRVRWLRRMPRLARGYLYDLSRYSKYSAAVHYDDSEEKLRAMITVLYHNIEKGLSLPAPRLGFGIANIQLLAQYIDELLDCYGPRSYLCTPISVLGAYVEYHERNDYAVLPVRQSWERLQSRNSIADHGYGVGGVKSIRRSDIETVVSGVSPAFFEQRFSCRQFSSRPITRSEIEVAVSIAQKAPVVCNRQSGRVHVFNEAADIAKVLALQGGARGFGAGVTTLFCLTVDLQNFNGSPERYQGWIDGGLFAMSFLLGLHSQSIGACCLNWSKDPGQDLKMRQLIGLAESESIIMFVAAGHLPDDFVVAKSLRKPVSSVLVFDRLGT
jgi:nitroreductase